MPPIVLAVETKAPTISVNSFRIKTAPTVPEMHAVLGLPSRVESGETPAPIGYRNNHQHVYDALGLSLNEHHYTYLVQDITCWFHTHDPEFRFTPISEFAGQLIIDGVEMPLGINIREFLVASPCVFDGGFGGSWHFKFDGFSVFVSSRGQLLKSKRRSKVRKVTSVSLSWPHDPWHKPV